MKLINIILWISSDTYSFLERRYSFARHSKSTSSNSFHQITYKISEVEKKHRYVEVSVLFFSIVLLITIVSNYFKFYKCIHENLFQSCYNNYMKKQENKYYYIRVSSLTQNEIRQYDLLEIDELEENLYIDKSSGSNTNRTALKRLLRDLEKDITPTKILYVSSMDRLARNLRDLCALIEDITERLHTTIVFTSGALANTPITSSEQNPVGKLMINIFGAFAEYEREIIRERQFQGIKKWKESDAFINGIKRDTYKKYQNWQELKNKNPNLKIKELEKLTEMSSIQYRRCVKKELDYIREKEMS